MKLNQKGYMLVELVLSSVLAMTIALYLINLTYQFKNKNEDIYQSITYSKDKIAITKNIMNDLDNQIVTFIKTDSTKTGDKTIYNNYLTVISKKDSTENFRNIQIVQSKEGTSIFYGKWNKNTNSFDKSDVSYYEKELDKSLIVRNVKVEFEKNSNYLSIIIPTESMYTKDRYNVTLFVVCNISRLFFDSNGGDAWNTGSCSGNFVFSDDECFKIIENSKYGEMPIPTKSGYIFLGWYDQKDGGTKISEDMSLELGKDKTIYAHWEKDYLIKKDVGSYVKYSGTNGCSGDCNGRVVRSCDGYGSAYSTGFRIAYKKEGVAYLVAASGVSCTQKKKIAKKFEVNHLRNMKSEYFAGGYQFNEETGYFELLNVTSQKYLISSSNYQTIINNYPYFCSSYMNADDERKKCGEITKLSRYYLEYEEKGYNEVGVSEYIFNTDISKAQQPTIDLFNQLALKYCNRDFIYQGICSNNNIWAMNANDFYEIVGKKLYHNSSLDSSCYLDSSDECQDDLKIINNGVSYYLATALQSNVDDDGPYDSSVQSNDVFQWQYKEEYFFKDHYSFSGTQAIYLGKLIRPIIKLNPEIYVVSGDGTKENPYEIKIDG